MANEFKVDWKGFDKGIEDALISYPKTAEKSLRKAVRELRKVVVDATPIGEMNKSENKHMANNWKIEITGFRGDRLEGNLYSKSPHYHLIERGHSLEIKGNVLRHIPGTFFFKKTVLREGDAIARDGFVALQKALIRKIERGRK